MTRFTLAAVAALALCLTACKDDASCDKVVDHTLGLLPAEMKAALGDKAAMIKQCEGASKAARSCALAAKSMDDLMKCPKE